MQTAGVSQRTSAVDQNGTPQETPLCAGFGETAAAALRECLRNAHLVEPETGIFACRLWDEDAALVLVAFEASPLDAVRVAQAMNRKASRSGGR